VGISVERAIDRTRGDLRRAGRIGLAQPPRLPANAVAESLSVQPPTPGHATFPGLTAIQAAIVAAVAYADVFDAALAPDAFLPSMSISATSDEVDRVLREPSPLQRVISIRDGRVTLAGREHLVAVSLRRAAASARLWPVALRYAGLIATLPFVRMVAVSGSLAVDNAEDGSDIDFMVVTEDGRLWLTRALAIGVVRAAATRGVQLCPNYFLAESALEIHDRSIYTAHELAQLVPVSGQATYGELLRRNAWYRAFLPNHPGSQLRPAPPVGRPALVLRDLSTPALRVPPVDRIERWEMRRKIRRLRALAPSAEAQYSVACCKGHADDHGRRTIAAFEARLARLREVLA